MKLALLLLVPVLACGSDLWHVSVAAYSGAQAFDAASSLGRIEANPLMRSADGRFGTRGIAIKAGITGAVVLGQYLILRRRPQARRALAVVNFGVAAGVGVVGARNLWHNCGKRWH